jgi:hypothetical protein
MSCNAIAGFSPALKKVSLGIEASKRIFKVIDRIPKINLRSGGLKLDNFQGRI